MKSIFIFIASLSEVNFPKGKCFPLKLISRGTFYLYKGSLYMFYNLLKMYVIFYVKLFNLV